MRRFDVSNSIIAASATEAASIDEYKVKAIICWDFIGGLLKCPELEKINKVNWLSSNGDYRDLPIKDLTNI
jgi:hypothetical protein